MDLNRELVLNENVIKKFIYVSISYRYITYISSSVQIFYETIRALNFPQIYAASQEYGNIPMASLGGSRKCDDSAASAVETRNSTKFLPSNSTDR